MSQSAVPTLYSIVDPRSTIVVVVPQLQLGTVSTAETVQVGTIALEVQPKLLDLLIDSCILHKGTQKQPGLTLPGQTSLQGKRHNGIDEI